MSFIIATTNVQNGIRSAKVKYIVITSLRSRKKAQKIDFLRNGESAAV